MKYGWMIKMIDWEQCGRKSLWLKTLFSLPPGRNPRKLWGC